MNLRCITVKKGEFDLTVYSAAHFLSSENDLTSEIENAVESMRQMGFSGLWYKLTDEVKAYLPTLLSVLAFLVCALAAIWVIVWFARRTLKRSKVDAMLHYFIITLIKYAALVVVVIAAVGMLGFPLTPIITAFGAVGLAFSLAIKDSLSNLAGGVFLLFNRPFKTGDYIELKGVAGTVTEIRLTYTVLKTSYNRHIFVPNGDFSKATITNYSMSDIRCMELTFSVKPESNITRAQEIILEVLSDSALVLPEPEPSVMVSDHTEIWVRILCKAWVKPENLLELKSYSIQKVREEFTKEGM